LLGCRITPNQLCAAELLSLLKRAMFKKRAEKLYPGAHVLLGCTGAYMETVSKHEQDDIFFTCFFPFCSPTMIPMALTKRQKQVLDFIANFVDDNGYSPSYEEIAHGLDLASLATVHKHISALETKSYVKRGFNRSRSLELGTKYAQEHRRQREMEIPLLGKIAAGQPVEAIEQRATLSFADFTGHRDTYALEVRGDSMIEDHICDGDMILIERTSEVRDGEIVVALVSGLETTLKRIYREGDTIRLQPANSALQPIYVPAAEVQVQGRLLAVLRKYK
jgi:repressor LexA